MKTRTIREPRVLTRERLMAKLERAYPNTHIVLSEYHDGGEGGIYIATDGEEFVGKDGLPIHDYYAYTNSRYEFGIANHFKNFIERQGWSVETYDPAGITLWDWN